MGAPKRNRKQYEKPKDIWNLQRISSDGALIEEFGLKNMRELWKIQTEMSRIRRNVRTLLSGSSAQNASVQEQMLTRLSKYGIATKDSTLDNLLDLKEAAFLSRRLQTIVLKRGMAKTAKQARQIIVHGFVSINGKRVNRPGYLVDIEEEKHIGFYKPIDLGAKPPKEPEAPAAEAKTEGVKA